MNASKHPMYWTFTLITILIPIVGFILGIVYLCKNNDEDRKVGEHAFSLSILMTIIYIVIILL